MYGSYGELTPPPTSSNGHELIPGASGAPCLLHAASIEVLSFVVLHDGRRYVHDGPSYIDIRRLPRGSYQLVLVQDFDREYRNPDLRAFPAAIVAIPVNRDGDSPSASAFPLEGRSLGDVGLLVIR